MKKNELTEILGYEPGRTLRLMILKDVKEKGISIGEAASTYQMPAVFQDLENTGMIDTPDGRMTPGKYEKLHPYKKIVIIKTRENL